MIFTNDLLIANILCHYMRKGGYLTSLVTDCLTFAHVLRRVYPEMHTKEDVLHLASSLLDFVFMTGLRANHVMPPSDLRLYTRVFIASRLPPLLQVWNSMTTTRIANLDSNEYNSCYDVSNSGLPNEGEVYTYFTDRNGTVETLLLPPSDMLKMLTLRRHIDIQTLTNALAGQLQRVVFVHDDNELYTEENTQPLKVYQNDEIDNESHKLLTGKSLIKSFIL
jgi:hypothetical protein